MSGTGELSKLFEIDRTTLNYYVKSGLIRPALSKNQYHQYGFSDSMALAFIRYYRGLDFSTEEITSLLNRDTNEEKIRRMNSKKTELMDQIESGLKAVRSAEIGKASIAAAEAPLAVMEDSAKGLALAVEMPGCSNANLLSDVLVATHCFSSGLLSAYYNVEANLPAIRRRDAGLAEELLDRAGSLIIRGQELAEEVMRKAGK